MQLRKLENPVRSDLKAEPQMSDASNPIVTDGRAEVAFKPGSPGAVSAGKPGFAALDHLYYRDLY